MTDEPPTPPTISATVSAEDISPEDLAKLLTAGPVPGGRKFIVATLIAAIGIGASVMSCVGQSFTYRQAHALEGIEQQLKEIRAGCGTTPLKIEAPR